MPAPTESLTNSKLFISQLPSTEQLQNLSNELEPLLQANRYREVFLKVYRVVSGVELNALLKVEPDLEQQWKQLFSNLLCRLGRCHLLGHGSTKQFQKASHYFSKALSLCPTGESLYHNGLIKQRKDPVVARNLFERGAKEFEHPECMYRYGMTLLNHPNAAVVDESSPITSTQEAKEEAFALFEKCADMDSSNGYYGMAVCYDMGVGVPKSSTEAMRLYNKAVDKGSLDAMTALYNIYTKGRLGQHANENLAEYYAKMGSAMSHAKSKFHLGVLLSKSDPFKAALYFQEALILGHPADACIKKQSQLRFNTKRHAYSIKFVSPDSSLTNHTYTGSIYEADYCGKRVLVRFVNQYEIGIPVGDLTIQFNSEMQENNRCAGPHNVKVHTVLSDESFAVVCYDPVVSDLNSYLYTHREMNERLRSSVVSQIASGMHQIHNHSLLHTALTCGTIGVMNSGRIKVIGVGNSLLGALFEHIENAKENMYQSPEVRAGNPHTVRSDIYSFGLVMYKVLTGALPSKLLNSFVKQQAATGQHQTAAETKTESVKKQSTSSVEENAKETVAEGTAANYDPLQDLSSESAFQKLSSVHQRIILRCCDPIPEQRFRSFEEICNMI